MVTALGDVNLPLAFLLSTQLHTNRDLLFQFKNTTGTIEGVGV